MPTAAKLVSALVFAMIALGAASLHARSVGTAGSTGVLREVSAAVGALGGWTIMGAQVRRAGGRIEAMGTGVRTSLTIAVVVTVIFAVVSMLEQAFEGYYNTPLDAALGVVERSLALAPALARAEVLSVLLLGGMFGGALAHWVSRRWT